MSFWSCNIDTKGRLIRGVSGLVLILAAVPFLFAEAGIVAIALLIAGIFCLFQALKGWCALRALKVKTPW
jgi:hypothetical protein